MITLILEGHSFQYELECLLMLFFPGQKIVTVQEEPESGDWVRCTRTDTALTAEGKVGELRFADSAPLPRLGDGENAEFEKACERGFALLLYHALTELTGIRPPWGVLTGIRPIKLVRELMETGKSSREVEEYFMKTLLASEKKTALALETARRELALLRRSTPNSCSLYISIPFCPTRCHYCSFVSHSIERAKKLLPEYLDLLCKELSLTGSIIRELGLKLQTIYVGGGTPTTLTAAQMQQLTDAIAQNFDIASLMEYTIEAGRPDTIDEEKLRVMKDRGVSRISINPQTMNDSVLEAIGRRHTSAQTLAAYELARKVGFDSINMDLIAGLFTDTFESFRHSVDTLVALEPENITVHTLSIKRSSTLGEQDGKERLAAGEGVGAVAQMVDYAQHTLLGHGYFPYYLYRQKNTLQNLENTGFCKEGYESAYNVYIMDETHSILAAGAGGVTKLRQPGGDLIRRVFNFKYPYEYISRFEEILKRKGQVKAFYEDHNGASLQY